MPHKRVLYIEDNVYNQRLIKKLLEPHGLKVDEATDGIQGIRKAMDLRPDLILVDLNLPYLDGLGTTTKIKSLSECNQIPIVALVSNHHPEDRERALVAGCDGVIDMPVDAEKFPSQVEEFLHGKRSTHDSAKKSAILKDYSLVLIDQLQDKLEALESANRELARQKIELEKSYEASQKANEELQRLNKLKQHIVAVSSHELRTPLSLAVGYVDLLKEGFVGPINEEQCHVLTETHQSLDRLENLIDKISDLSRISHKKFPSRPKKLALHEAFRQVHKDLAYFMELRKLKWQELLEGKTAEVWADPELIEQIFSNLLRNAMCYTPDGGTITSRCWSDSENAYFSMSDTGIGIESHQLESIFDEFYQIQEISHHKSGQFEFLTRGLGLGLSICRAILNELGGKIWAESEGKDQGSTFTFFLPRAG
ncbi:MAG: hybrid sensor histidine kinase/response regulator [Acidobacteria bacterium]|nr:hybrid sensor histidine kinase/response regulator [Acidobacteriota bacterium]MCB9397536.1 hybrid sensor histidine kinase/response regulator [Acidobacteriota bacterium]